MLSKFTFQRAELPCGLCKLQLGSASPIGGSILKFQPQSVTSLFLNFFFLIYVRMLVQRHKSLLMLLLTHMYVQQTKFNVSNSIRGMCTKY